MRSDKQLSTDVADIVELAARSLSHSIKKLGFLNGEIDAPIPEQNLLMHLAHEFLVADYKIYAQPALEVGKSRIDLLVCNDVETIVIEAKAVGTRNPARMLSDFRRILQYSPNPAPRTDGLDPKGFWINTKPRHFGLLVVESFGGDEYTELWRDQTLNDGTFERKLGEYSRLRKSGKDAWLELANELRQRDGESDSIRALDGCEWEDTGPLDVLWAKFVIKGEMN